MQLALDTPSGGRPALVIFTLPIMVSAYAGGVRGGLLATALSCLGAGYYLLAPTHSFRISSGIDRWQQFLLALSGVVITALAEALHRARHRVDMVIDERSHLIRQLETDSDALRESNQNFQHLTDNITDAFWIRSADMHDVHYISPAFERIWGRTVASLYANPRGWADFVLPEDRERVLNAFARLTADGAEVDIEYRIVRPDGEVRWIRARGFQVRDGADSLIRHTGIVTDITARKRAEAALQESEGRYRALVEWSPEPIAVSRNGTILFINPAAVRMMGATSEQDLLGRPLLDLVHPDFRQLVRERIARNKAHGGSLPMIEERFIKMDGTIIDVEIQGTSIVYDGEPAIFSSMRDVTEKKRLESQFLRAQRMESIGTLAGGIAHDLNNVLAPILMSVEILSEQVKSEDDRALLATLHNSAQRGADLVKQVLSFARGVEGERIPVNPLHLMRDLLKVMGDTFPKSIDVRFTPAPDLWTVTGDPTQMHQVFLNLCINARDAMPDGGHLTVSLSNVVLDENDVRANRDARPGSYVMLKVQDSGTGIPLGTRDKIFEPFFTTKEIGKGTGLGLSTTLAIVKSHQGFIQLYSELGTGTTFNVYLPANTAQAAGEDGVAFKPTRLPRGHGELILVVDDEEGIRAIARRTLERYGYRVLLASEGADAVSVYARHREDIAVVLTDMTMPIMDGPALIIALKGMNPGVRIIGSSGLTSRDGVDSAVGEAIEYFLPKPYTADALLNLLRQVLGDHDPPMLALPGGRDANQEAG